MRAGQNSAFSLRTNELRLTSGLVGPGQTGQEVAKCLRYKELVRPALTSSDQFLVVSSGRHTAKWLIDPPFL